MIELSKMKELLDYLLNQVIQELIWEGNCVHLDYWNWFEVKQKSVKKLFFFWMS